MAAIGDKAIRKDRSTFFSLAETFSQAGKRKRSRLAGQSQKSGSSNCLKLEEQTKTTEGEQMSEEHEPWMKLSDVADASGLALSTIYYLHKTGKGPRFSRLGRNIRVKRSDFDEWFESNRDN